jgi:hypothetical protein
LSEVHGSIQDLRNTQVTENQTAIAQQKHVLRLQIAMQDTVTMHVMQAQSQLDKPVQNFAFRE